MKKFICEKCGKEFEEKPIQHGKIALTIYGKKLGKDEICKGKIIPLWIKSK